MSLLTYNKKKITLPYNLNPFFAPFSEGGGKEGGLCELRRSPVQGTDQGRGRGGE